MPSPSLSRLASVMSWRLASLGAADTPLSMRLAEEMGSRWQRGERPTAEEFFDRHPELWKQPEAAMQLIYEEICLRQEHGEPDAAAVIARFPQWRPSLEALLACHE